MPPIPFGPLGKSLDDEVANRLAGKTPQFAIPMYSVADSGTGTYIRNPGCWLADVDLTGISPWNSAGGNQRAGTAISPKHVIYARHFPLGIGTTIRFIAADNSVVDRVIAAQTGFNDPTGFGGGVEPTDVIVATLNEPLPPSIRPLMMMPLDVRKKCQCPPEPGARVCNVDQDERALVFRMVRSELFQPAPPNFTTMAWNNPDPEWGEEIISGDSGNPMFVILDGKAVLWSHDTGPGGGPNYHHLAALIRGIVQADGEDVEYADLSRFEDRY